MAESKDSVWSSGFTVNLVSNFISLVVGGFVTYLQHDGSAWVKPFLYGAAAWLITFVSILAVRISRNVVPRPKPTTVDNIQGRLRDWLDRFGMTVKTVADQNFHFVYIVTTDGGKKITILRSKDHFSDYILVRGWINADEAAKKVLDTFSEEEKIAVILAMKLELSRAVMGYKSESSILEEITVFKRIPITPLLNEEEIINLVWEIEAMLGTIFTVGSVAVLRHETKEAPEIKTV